MEQGWKEVESLLHDYERAVREGDVDKILSYHADDVAAFDLVLPFDIAGKATLKQRISDWIHGYQPGLDFHFKEMGIVARGELAVCHALVHTRGTLKNGEPSEMWTRSTLALRKAHGHWEIFHEHTSDPIDLESGKAVFERTA